MRMAELAFNAAKVSARDQQTLDLRAHRVMAAAEQTLHELVHQSLHAVQIAALVGGATPDELETNVAETRSRLGANLKSDAAAARPGRIAQALEPHPAHADGSAAQTAHDALARRCLLPRRAGLPSPGCNQRDLLGPRQPPLRPALYRSLPRQPGRPHGHPGEIGAGKTFFLNLLALRGALEGYRVIGLDAFKNGQRVEMAAQGGARCYALGFRQTINILDIVYGEDDWRPNQVQHVIGMLQLLLGTPGKSADGRDRLVPQEFSIIERGLLDRALTSLYAPLQPDTPLDQVPILSDLVALLRDLGEVESDTLARQIHVFVDRTSVGPSFNGHTTVDWQFGSDITYYDVSEVEELYRPLYYALTIGAILRFMRDPRRDRSRKTMLQIDEFGYLTQVEALGRLAATIAKVARKYGIGLIAIDQNPITFLSNDHGRFIFENAAAKVLFHLDDLPARQMAEAISDIRPGHVAYLTRAGKGMALAIVGNDVYTMNVEANPYELRMLRGS
ncbi:hypothetical protein HC891_26515 [Candidatus Gracilibacteria bacterium]|nr:hypothetical protein [Candidatus Gracilibacteria bacterium]